MSVYVIFLDCVSLVDGVSVGHRQHKHHWTGNERSIRGQFAGEEPAHGQIPCWEFQLLIVSRGRRGCGYAFGGSIGKAVVVVVVVVVLVKGSISRAKTEHIQFEWNRQRQYQTGGQGNLCRVWIVCANVGRFFLALKLKPRELGDLQLISAVF